jgi:lysophospholipase L1-like esterase
LVILLGAVAITGCGNGDDDDDVGDAGGGFDASTDATTDGGKDAGKDAAKDGGDAGDATTTGQGDGGDGGDAASSGTDAGDAAADSGVDAGPDAGPTSLIHFYGRFDTVDEGASTDAPIFDWSGSGIVTDFVGTGIAVSLTNFPYSQSGYNELQVIVDGTTIYPTTSTGPGLVLDDHGQCALGDTCSATYTIASGLADKQHHVEIYKRTEALYGEIQFEGFQNVSGGTNDWALVPTPDPLPRRIEFIGDSITAGYGVLGTNPCNDDGDYNDVYLAYSGDTAHQLGASFVAIAHSGEGVYMDTNGDTSDPIGLEYTRTVDLFSESVYDFSTQVDAVVINLGTNDFDGYNKNHSGNPGTKFTKPYEALVTTVRASYPNAYILLLAGPLITESYPYPNAYDDLQTDLETVVNHFTANGDTKIASLAVGIEPDCTVTGQEALCGCADHPSVSEQSTVATKVAGALKAALGW